MDRDGTIHIDKVETYLIDNLEFFSDTVSFMQIRVELGKVIMTLKP